jgi:hypothetical protein
MTLITVHYFTKFWSHTLRKGARFVILSSGSPLILRNLPLTKLHISDVPHSRSRLHSAARQSNSLPTFAAHSWQLLSCTDFSPLVCQSFLFSKTIWARCSEKIQQASSLFTNTLGHPSPVWEEATSCSSAVSTKTVIKWAGTYPHARRMLYD